MKNERGIGLIKLIFIVVAIIIVGIIFISVKNQVVEIKWGYMPSTEYYELKLAATTSEVYGSGQGTLSLESFNTLGRDVKKAGGKWFKDSSVNFRASVEELNDGELTTLTDGEHTAIFTFTDGDDCVYYTFSNEDHTGYRITIK